MSLATALQLHQSGQLDQATALYEQVLRDDPGNADAWHLRGVALHQRGDHPEALTSIERAITLNSRAAAFHNNLASVHNTLGQPGRAVQALQQAHALAPRDQGTSWNLAGILAATGEHSAAAEAFLRTWDLSPEEDAAPARFLPKLLEAALGQCQSGDIEGAARTLAGIGDRAPQTITGADPALHSLLMDLLRRLSREHRDAAVVAVCRRLLEVEGASAGVRFRYAHALERTGQSEAATAVYQSAVQVDAGHAAAWLNLGNLHQSAGRFRTAIDCYRSSLAADSTSAGAWNNLGTALSETGDQKAARDAFENAIRHAPRMADAHYNLANCLRQANEFEEAATCYERALAIAPDCPRTLVNLGVARKHQRRLDESAACYERALAICPDLPEARFNRGLLRLLRGDLGRGWDDYEFRRDDSADKDRLPIPEWNGDGRPGGTLILTTEQGVGDEVMFASCLPDVADRFEQCVMECDPRLVPLFSRSFTGIEFIAKGTVRGCLTSSELPQPIHSLPIGSLPRWTRRRMADFPSSPRWLRAGERPAAAWQQRLCSAETGRTSGRPLRIGIAWQGGREAEVRQRRSTRLSQWAPLLNQSDVSFINLQHGEAASQFATQRGIHGGHLLSLNDIDPLRNLDDLAALITALDLVITIDNSTAHLAGALGVPTWLLLGTASDWRWMLDRNDSPWYRSLRLFRQPRPGDWESVFARVADELRQLTPRRDVA